jgi:integrase/recombinase XerD
MTSNLLKKMDGVLNEQFYDDLIKKLIVHILYDTGMRVSELCDLDISNLEETDTPGLRCATIRRRKSLRYNTVVWGKETNRLMNLYLGLRLCLDVNQTDALFVIKKSKGNRITARTVQRWIKEICLEAGIPEDITPHSFRHGKAHQVLNQSGNVRDVQAILGHVNPASSFSYLSLNRQSQIAVSGKYLPS